MKRNFLTGLAILLPIVLTVAIVMFFINLLTKPFLEFVHEFFFHTGLIDFPFLSSRQAIYVISKILILIFLVLTTFLIGFFTTHLFANYFFTSFDKIIHKIPVVNKIYKALQEVMHTMFSPENTTFSQVALVPFPQENTYCMGFVTKDSLPEGSDKEHVGLISVYIPGTPNPMMGFNFLYRRDQVIFISMKVDDALKFVISCGVMFPGFEKSEEEKLS
jgi:uncharacterized membrane protein